MAQDVAMMREKQFNIRFSEEESARLEELTQHYSLNGAAVVRMLLKKDYDRVQVAGSFRWSQFVRSVREFEKLSEIPNLKVSVDEARQCVRLSDGKRPERPASFDTEAFVILNQWPGSQLACDETQRAYNKRTGLDAEGNRIRPAVGDQSKSSKKK